MVDRVLPKEQVSAFLDYLRRRYRLWAPVAQGGGFVFAEIDHPESIRLDYPTTMLPPKAAFLPPNEILLSIDMESLESAPPPAEDKPIALLGVHPCDLHGLMRLDMAMREEPSDASYVSARRGALIIGLACVHRCRPEAFCDSMETFRGAAGADLYLTPIEDGFWVEVRDGAEESLADAADCFRPPSDRQKREKDDINRQIDLEFSGRRLSLETLADDLEKTYTSSYWAKLADRCFSCGACTAVCPTCVCFDVRDDLAGGCKTADRCRSWDSCLLKDFAAVAGNENFRPKRHQRLRHRMMRQGSYLAKRFNLPAFCVGCGRCPAMCLGKISPLEAFEFSQKGRTVHV